MKRILFILALAAVALWAYGLACFVARIPKTPSTGTETTDAIVILTGGSLRMEHGLSLLRGQRAGKLFVSGVEGGLTVPELLRSKELRQFETNTPLDRITLGYKAHSTSGNALEVAQWATANHIGSIRLVTGNYHIPRSVMEIHAAIPSLRVIPEPVFPKHFEDNAWWMSADSLRLVISEYHKYLASLLWHRLTGTLPQGG